MSKGTDVNLKVEPPWAWITFSTEEGLNVLSRDVIVRLGNVVEDLGTRDNVRWTLVRATGKVFVAGADIKELASLNAARAKDFSSFGNRVMDALASLPCITVAAIHGAALGGGFEVALACDFRFAVKGVKVGLPETSLGVIPGWGGTQRSLRLGGPSVARRLMFGANPISAVEGLELGLIDGWVDNADALEPTIREFCLQLKRGGPHAISMVKRAMLTGDEPSAFAGCFEHPQAAEGISAFLDKKSASWMEISG